MTGSLVLRVWVECDSESPLRARILIQSVDDISPVYASTTDAVCDIVRDWIEGLASSVTPTP